MISTRGWFYFVPAKGEPEKILHAIEPGALDHLPGRSFFYSSQKELSACLRRFSAHKIAVQISKDLAIISYLDYGMAQNLQDAGIKLVSSATLVQRLESLFDERMKASHEAAADHLYAIVESVWERIRKEFPGRQISEGEVQGWILDEFSKRGLETDHPPIVSAGAHSGDPHYAPEAGGAQLKEGDVLQFDLWAKHPGGVFADISWVGVLAGEAPEDVKEVFSAVVSARDGCIDFINSRLAKGIQVEGREADIHTRSIIEKLGYGRYLKHRTGHSIDTECHGSGVNLDSVEFPDSRKLLEGSCFSVEPGIYLDTFGMRTEIDAYIQDGKAVVSGRTPQSSILTLS